MSSRSSSRSIRRPAGVLCAAHLTKKRAATGVGFRDGCFCDPGTDLAGGEPLQCDNGHGERVRGCCSETSLDSTQPCEVLSARDRDRGWGFFSARKRWRIGGVGVVSEGVLLFARGMDTLVLKDGEMTARVIYIYIERERERKSDETHEPSEFRIMKSNFGAFALRLLKLKIQTRLSKAQLFQPNATCQPSIPQPLSPPGSSKGSVSLATLPQNHHRDAHQREAGARDRCEILRAAAKEALIEASTAC